MRLSVFSLVFLGGLLVLNSSAWAQSQTGMFMVVKGDVKVTSIGKTPVTVKVGSKVSVGDVVETGKDSRAKITMIDRNVIQVSPESRLEISKYISDAKKGVKDIELTLHQGKVRNEVNDVYDGEKTKFQLKTPTAVAGVRGTQFVTSYSPSTRKTDIVTLQGKVNFTSMLNGKPVGASVDVKVGETASATAGAAPEPPRPVPQNELKSIESDTTASNTPPPKGSGDVANNNNQDKKDKKDKKDKNIDGDRSPASETAPRMDAPAFDPKNDMPPVANMPGVNMPEPPRLPNMPTANPIVRDIVRDGAAKTKVIVKPQY